MKDLVYVRGLSDLQKMLNTLPAKIEKNIMRGALRAGMNVVKADAINNTPVDSGVLKAGMKVSTRARRGKITASLKATGKHAHLAHLIEFGTNPHMITGKDGKPLKMGEDYFDFVSHPGQAARPFMRPALDQNVQSATVAVGEYLKKRLATKHGLDTSNIVFDGDE